MAKTDHITSSHQCTSAWILTCFLISVVLLDNLQRSSEFIKSRSILFILLSPSATLRISLVALCCGARGISPTAGLTAFPSNVKTACLTYPFARRCSQTLSIQKMILHNPSFNIKSIRLVICRLVEHCSDLCLQHNPGKEEIYHHRRKPF